MAGVFVYSPDQMKSRFQEEIDKFNINLGSGIYNKDLVALTFQEASLGVFGSIAVIYSKETGEIIVTHNGKEVRGSEALNLLNNIIKSADEASPTELEVSIETKSESESHAGMNFGASGATGLANASNSNALASNSQDAQIQAATTSTQSEQIASQGQSIESGNFANRIERASEASAVTLAQSDHFVDSIKFLCEQFASESISDIEYIESLQPQAPEEDVSSAVTREIQKATETSDTATDTDITTSEVTKKVEEKSQTETSTDSSLPASESEIKRPIPAQIRKISLGEPSFGVSGDSMSIALFGTMHVVKRLAGYEMDLEGRVILDSPKFQEVVVEEIMLGLKEGVYVAEHYEDSNLGISPGIKGQPAEPIYFRIQKPRPRQQEEEIKVEKEKSDIDEMERKARERAAEAERIAKDEAAIEAAKREEYERAAEAKAEERAKAQYKEEQRRQAEERKTKVSDEMKKYLNELIARGLPQEEQEVLVRQVERMISVGASVLQIASFVEGYIKNRQSRRDAAAAKDARENQKKGDKKNGGKYK